MHNISFLSLGFVYLFQHEKPSNDHNKYETKSFQKQFKLKSMGKKLKFEVHE